MTDACENITFLQLLLQTVTSSVVTSSGRSKTEPKLNENCIKQGNWAREGMRRDATAEQQPGFFVSNHALAISFASFYLGPKKRSRVCGALDEVAPSKLNFYFYSVFNATSVIRHSIKQYHLCTCVTVACVRNSVRGGVCLSACWDTTPQDQAHPRPGTAPSWDQVHPPTRHTPPPPRPGTPKTRHPPAQCMLGDMVNKRAVCILLECNLVAYL